VRSPYDVLGVSPTATQDELRRAFAGCSLEHHPDTNGGTAASNERMREILAAYDAVKSPEARAQTDARLRMREPKRASSPAPPTTAEATIRAIHGFATLVDMAIKYRASRSRERARPEPPTKAARCKAGRVDGKRCMHPALAGNYGFCGVHRR
jgi:curved DNA-binding protein CbpA